MWFAVFLAGSRKGAVRRDWSIIYKSYKLYCVVITCMRCQITVQKISPVAIHYDYQYGLASMLYARLASANITLANSIHSHQGFKLYTFSNLVIEDWIQIKGGLNFTRAHFFLSSPDPEFIRSFTEGLLL